MAKKLAKKRTFVTMPEMIEMKVLEYQGLPVTQIAEKVGRGGKTVKKYLTIFEDILPEAGDLKNKILDSLDDIKDQMMNNAWAIGQKADMQVFKTLFSEDTTALDAAKISEMYGRRLAGLAGFDDQLPGKEAEKSPKVINFIENLNIIQNDRSQRPPTIKGEIIKNDSGGKTAIVEGAMS